MKNTTTHIATNTTVGIHVKTGVKVAIKITNRSKLKKMKMGEKLRTEIHVLRLLQHPHIIRLYVVRVLSSSLVASLSLPCRLP
jgi:serine/threonine protein kinase